MRLAIGSWSFHSLFDAGQMSVFGYLETIKYRYHLQEADIWTGMMQSTEEPYIRALKESLDEGEIAVACLATDRTHVWDADPDMQERNHRNALRYLEIAATLEAHTLRIDMGPRTQTLTEDQFDFLVKRYREYAHIAQESGFQIGPQTHQPPAQVPQNVKRLCEAVSSSGFGIVLDIGRWLADAQLGDALCAPYAMHVHFDSSRTDFSQGLANKVRMLREADYKGCWALEYRRGGSEYLGVACDLAQLQHAVWETAEERARQGGGR